MRLEQLPAAGLPQPGVLRGLGRGRFRLVFPPRLARREGVGFSR